MPDTTPPVFPITPPPPTPNPFAALLRSRKFLLAVAALITTLLSTYAGLAENVIMSINGVIGAVILGIALEDAATNSSLR